MNSTTTMITDLPNDILRKIALTRQVLDEALFETNDRFQVNVRQIIRAKNDYKKIASLADNYELKEHYGKILKKKIAKNVKLIKTDVERICKHNNKDFTFNVEDNEDFGVYTTNISDKIQEGLALIG